MAEQQHSNLTHQQMIIEDDKGGEISQGKDKVSRDTHDNILFMVKKTGETPDTFDGSEQNENDSNNNSIMIGVQEYLQSTALLRPAATQALLRNHHHKNSSSVRMEDMISLMREQDADLLESIHMQGPNQSGIINNNSVFTISRSGQDLFLKQQIQLERLADLSHPDTNIIVDEYDNKPPLSPAGMKPPHRSQSKTHTNKLLLLRKSSSGADSITSPLRRTPSITGEVDTPENDELFVSLDQLDVNQQEASPATEVVVVGDGSDTVKTFARSRRALSGEVFVKDGKLLTDQEVISDDYENERLLRKEYESVNGDEYDTDKQIMKRTDSTERRINEAAQFAEAVGDLPLKEQEDLRIIDDGDAANDDDDDDDDDATEIHVEGVIRAASAAKLPRPKSKSVSTSALISLQQSAEQRSVQEQQTVKESEQKLALQHQSSHTATSGTNGSLLGPETPVTLRRTTAVDQYYTYPSQHYSGSKFDQQTSNRRRSLSVDAEAGIRHTGFLAQLPSTVTSSSQDFVYKGIRANPPEIVKRGTTRGNYAQLHRKAWLEVSDKYHRYGKHLRLYYRHWENIGCPTNMFFDWLDSKGEAAGQPLPELAECPRSQLDSDTVLYITNPEVSNGYALRLQIEETPNLDYDNVDNDEVMRRGKILDVDGDPVKTGSDGWIFVLRDNILYGNKKITSVSGHSKQRFHHSSFFGGKAVAAAGIFITDNDGFLTRLYPHSGHYRPGEAHMQRVLFFLYHEGVDLRTFEMDTQQILHVSRDAPIKVKESKSDDENTADGGKIEKKKKTESLHLLPAVMVACFLAHKARFIGEGIFTQIHQIRNAGVTSVTEALEVIDDGGYWPLQGKRTLSFQAPSE